MKIKIKTIQAGVPTLNDRIYSKKVLNDAIAKANKLIKQGRLLCYYDSIARSQHPASPLYLLSNVCGVVKRLHLSRDGYPVATIKWLKKAAFPFKPAIHEVTLWCIGTLAEHDHAIVQECEIQALSFDFPQDNRKPLNAIMR